jgi:hypothetical protein
MIYFTNPSFSSSQIDKNGFLPAAPVDVPGQRVARHRQAVTGQDQRVS